MTRQQVFSILLSTDPARYTIISGHTALIPGVEYRVTVGAPRTLAGNLPQAAVLSLSEDTDKALTSVILQPSASDPYGTMEGTLYLHPDTYRPLFDSENPPSTVVLNFSIASEDAVFLSSAIAVSAPLVTPEQTTTLSWDQALLNALKFTDLKQFKAWLSGDLTRPDGVRPQDLVYGSIVHTQMEGSFMLVDAERKPLTLHGSFAPLGSPFPIHGYAKVTAENGEGGMSVHGLDVYDIATSTQYGLSGIRASDGDKIRTYTFDTFTTGIVTFADLSLALQGLSVDPSEAISLASRIATLEERVKQLSDSAALTAGEGVTIENGKISIDQDITKALSRLTNITDQSTLGDVADVARIAVAQSK